MVNIELAVLAAVFGLSQSGLSANSRAMAGLQKRQAGKESLPAFRSVMRYGVPLGTAMALPVADVGRRYPIVVRGVGQIAHAARLSSRSSLSTWDA